MLYHRLYPALIILYTVWFLQMTRRYHLTSIEWKKVKRTKKNSHQQSEKEYMILIEVDKCWECCSMKGRPGPTPRRRRR